MLQCPPLSERVFRNHTRIRTSVTAKVRCGKYKSWSELQMEKSLNAVISGSMSIRQSALEFNVPKSSLGDRVSGRVLPGTTSGPPRYLTLTEENELMQFLAT